MNGKERMGIIIEKGRGDKIAIIYMNKAKKRIKLKKWLFTLIRGFY